MTRSTEPEANDTPCERAEPLLSAHLLEELSGDEREAVADHLAACARCREELEMLSGAVSVLRSIPPLEAGLEPVERERILSAARESAAGARGTSWRVVYLAAGGLAAAAVLAVALIPGILPGPGVKDAGIQVARAPEPAPEPGPVRAAEEPTFEKLELAKRVTGVEGGGAVEAEGLALREAQRDPLDVLESLRTADGRFPTENEKRLDGAPGGDRLALTPRVARDSFFAENEGAESRRTLGMEPARGEAEKPAALQDLARADALSTRARFASPAKAKEPGGASRGGMDGTAPPTPDAGRRLTVDLAQQSSERKLHESVLGLEPTQSQRGAAAPEAEATRAPAVVETAAAPGRASRVYRSSPSTTEPGGANGALPDPASRPAPVGATPLSAAPPADRPAQAPPALVLETRLAAGPAAGATTAPASPAANWKERVDDILSRLDRRPGETPAMMFFRYWGTNPFVEASSDPLSTFAVDCDTASYTLARAYFYEQGILPPREAIRTEEFINFFKSRYAPPAADGPAFAVHAEMAPSPFAHEPDYQLLKVGLKGREVPKEKRKVCALVFVIDTSGSMRQGNRLELVKDSLRLLVPELDEGDTIGIVAFDREARVVLDPTPASEKERILDAVSRLEPRQNTNVGAGLELGYQMAARHKLKDGSNRVILLSDGVANTGNVDPVAITEKVRVEREQGIYLTCVGVGMGNMNDSLMERLADRGNGQCVYVDRIDQARKVFVENLTGTLEAIAKDAKIQVEFDPSKVIRYRLLGYENRDIADADFRNNEVDAGEVGAGHEVTALYELKLKPDAGDTLATIRVRYLTVDHGEAVEIARPVTPADRRKAIADASPRFQVSASAAELAEALRGSYWARGNTLDRVAALLEPLLGKDDGPSAKLGDDNDVVELVALARKADALVREREAKADDVARTSDAIKENHLLRAQVEDALRARSIDNRAQIDDILRQNEALRRRLEDLLRR